MLLLDPDAPLYPPGYKIHRVCDALRFDLNLSYGWIPDACEAVSRDHNAAGILSELSTDISTLEYHRISLCRWDGYDLSMCTDVLDQLPEESNEK